MTHLNKCLQHSKPECEEHAVKAHKLVICSGTTYNHKGLKESLSWGRNSEWTVRRGSGSGLKHPVDVKQGTSKYVDGRLEMSITSNHLTLRKFSLVSPSTMTIKTFPDKLSSLKPFKSEI